LFDLHYENNREHLVQAALLFTWHFEGAGDIAANAYYWIGIACRLAFGPGSSISIIAFLSVDLFSFLQVLGSSI
jgi:hypothetical protein